MASSKTEIANRAITKLGGQLVSNIETENSTPARLMNSMFDSVRDDVLRMHPWNFASTRTTLAALTSVPPFGWSFEYSMPEGFLRLTAVMTGGTQRNATVRYKFEGGKILTNVGPALNIIYVQRVTDVSQYDSNFVEAFASRLAMEGAEKLTQSNTKKQAAEADLFAAINKAKLTDAQENPTEDLEETSWLTSRNSGNFQDGFFDPTTTS